MLPFKGFSYRSLCASSAHFELKQQVFSTQIFGNRLRYPITKILDKQRRSASETIDRLSSSRSHRYFTTPSDSSSENNSKSLLDITFDKDKPILTELHYGRTRVYTALPPASTHSPTSSKASPAASSSPLYWQWQPQTTKAGIPEVRGPVSSFVGSIKQNLSAMFLPVGYPETVHECYAKFHIWLALETFIGSSTGVLCSQAMLSSLGLGQAESAAGAVAIQW
ncbi:6522_t:CDS:2 [Ambispora leptoticha]|uniref:6522_t:CDS:1 n=1 Tax=Ambispora leptoticha TaxID=144679 RepID=A0A9N8WFV9_9GLOM|nr:6522_t:CDS:2 [Ambispora leptoticha]